MPIFIAQSCVSPPRVTRRFAESQEPVSWIYLGRDHGKLVHWEEKLGSGFKRINYAQTLRDLARNWREPFIKWIGSLCDDPENIVWWTSRVSEKNVLLDTVHHSICYWEIARRIANQHSTLLIVTESAALIEQITNDSELNGSIAWVIRRSDQWERFRWLSLFVLKWGWYWVDVARGFWDSWSTRIGAERLPQIEPGKKIVLVHTCMDESYFSAEKDRYFTTLPAELRQRGCQVIYLPWLYNIRRSRRQAFKWFRARKNRYLIPEDFYHFTDHFWAMWQMIRQIWFPKGPLLFLGRDVTRLVKGIQLRQCTMVRTAPLIKYFRLIQRLKAREFVVDVFVDTFENMIGEKASVMGFKRFMPKTLTVGYQHWASPAPFMYCHFPDRSTLSHVPLPDKIVCVSPFTASLFEREGYPKEKIRVGPSLRYLHLLSNPQQVSGNPAVLVMLSLEEEATYHLLKLVVEALHDRTELALYLKPHPMMSAKSWRRACRNLSLPQTAVVVEGTFNEWIPKISAAIIGSSTSSIEVALAGVPLVQVGMDHDFEINVLDWFSDFDKPVYEAIELRQKVLKLISLSEAERTQYQKFTTKLREECLSPINDKTLNAFVEV